MSNVCRQREGSGRPPTPAEPTMLSNLSTTLQWFFGGSSTAEEGASLGGFLKRVLPTPWRRRRTRGPVRLLVTLRGLSRRKTASSSTAKRSASCSRSCRSPAPTSAWLKILVSLYATCPPGTGIQWMLFGSPHVLDCLSPLRQPARRRRRPRRKGASTTGVRLATPTCTARLPAGAWPILLQGAHARSPRATTTRCATSS